MNVFLDFDGTLIDSRLRLYKLFQDLVPKSNLNYRKYWELKRNKINHKEILTSIFNYSEREFSQFEEIWMNKIEQEEYLDLDKPFVNTTNFLIEFANSHNLYLVTARQSESNVINQIFKFGWQKIFTKVLVSSKKKEKHTLIRNNVSFKSEDWIIGDTGEDIKTGKLLEINTAAVLSGVLNKEQIKSLPN